MDLMNHPGCAELISLNFCSLAVAVSPPNTSGLLGCTPASHLLSESKLFTPQVGGNSHFSSINQALVTVHYRDTLIEFVIREAGCCPTLTLNHRADTKSLGSVNFAYQITDCIYLEEGFTEYGESFRRGVISCRCVYAHLEKNRRARKRQSSALLFTSGG